MRRKERPIVLDSWSIIAYLEDEPAGKQVAELIAGAHEEGAPLLMPVINLGEVWYIIAREISEQEANSSIRELRDLRIQFVDADWDLTQQAARFKARYRMSYADRFAAALAALQKATLVTGDQEFRQVEREVQIQWV